MNLDSTPEDFTLYHRKLITVLMFVWLLNSTFQMLHSILMPSIMGELGLNYTIIGLILLVVQLSTAVGSFFWGASADYLGRKKILSVLLPTGSFFLFLVGLSQNWFQLALALAAFSFVSSGIFPVVFTFASEALPPLKRGFGISVIASGYALGGGVLASLLAAKIGLTSWRTPFFVGVLPTILVLVGVLRLSESHIWLESADRGKREDGIRWMEKMMDFKPFKIWRGGNLRAVISAVCVRILASLLWVGVARWVTVFLVVERGMSMTVGTMWFTLFGVAGFFGNWFNGWCADRHGRKKTISLFFSIVGVLIILFTVFAHGELQALLMTAPLGFSLLGLYPTTFTFTTEVLPSEARASGIATISLFTLPLSIAVPGIIGAVSTAYSISLCFNFIGLMAIIGGLTLLFIIPETKAKVL
jgi:putative MFS transporter